MKAFEIKPWALPRGFGARVVARMSFEAAQGFAGGGPTATESRDGEKPPLVPKYLLAGTAGVGSARPR